MTVEILIGALALSVAAAVAAAVVAARARAAADDRVADAVRRLADGMQDTMRDLAVAYDRPHDGDGPPRRELSASLDLDKVAERTAAAAARLPGVDAAILEAAGPHGEQVRASAGLEDDDPDAVAVHVPPEDELRAVDVVYHYRAAGAGFRTGLVVPLRGEEERVGTLGVFSRSAERPFGEDTLTALETLAFHAGPALENARRFAEARRLADLDALTGLHNRRYFHETLAREISRARRYDRRLTLILLDLDDFKAVNDRIGHLAGDGVLVEVADRVRGVVRAADTPCRVGGDEFAVILPESGHDDGELLAGRVARAISARPIGPAGIVHMSSGIAELRPEDGAAELFERADDALYRAKDAGKIRPSAAGNDG